MTVIGGRGGRQDDWSSPHARARARAAERLDGPLDADESAWLEDHLASCAECAAIAGEYATQRLEMRALKERAPVPPRDLWARTSAALERESVHRTPRRRSWASSLRPYALLAGALVVAIVVGTLSSSQRPIPGPTTPPGTSPQIAVATDSPPPVAPTPIALPPQDVAYISPGRNGNYELRQGRFDEMCPTDATDCESDQMTESAREIGPLATPEAVYGADGKPLVIVGEGDQGSRVLALVVPAPRAGATSRPTASAPDGASDSPPPSETVSSAPPPSEEPTQSSAATPTPEVMATPEAIATPTEAAAETVDIAPGLKIIGKTAAYSPDGSAFAFTAQPTDGTLGPDIYVWYVGDDKAEAVTSDHKSIFGSWSGRDVIGSSLDVSRDGSSAAPTAIVVRGSDKPATLRGAGRAWRPAVDPKGETAVYWAGMLAPTGDPADWRAQEGRLVLGRWGDLAAPTASAEPTAPDATDQANSRNETTIEEGPLADWDARWDSTGTKLAVWVADPDDPSVGTLSLYEVDPFDGSIDLENPRLHDEPALAGFSIDDGRLAWAAPPDGSDDASRVLILAWTDDGFGNVESAPGDFVLVR
ncbi:MAG TPA: zf-HC2 domain-containing protein [Candidatus Limnocylindrales bacterium]|nr:zf-HC2 domain-containing protein [Candidatus Limnocylindrales bacterium]